jgi:hypothetical protein
MLTASATADAHRTAFQGGPSMTARPTIHLASGQPPPGDPRRHTPAPDAAGPASPPSPEPEATRRGLAAAVVVVAAILQLLVLVPFTIASGLLAPLWAVIALHLLWLTATVVLVRFARTRPFVTPAVPVANAALLWLVLTLGDVLLGWTA